MTAPKDGTTRASLDITNPNTLADHLRVIALGSLLAGQMPQVRRNVNPDALGVSPYSLATLDAVVLPAHAKASVILRATVRAGVGGTGEYTCDPFGTTPGGADVAVSPSGDIVFLGTDVVTDVDLVYIPERGDVVEAVFPVAADVLTLPASLVTRGVVLLAEVEALEGGAVGNKIVLIPGAGPAAGQAALGIAKGTVAFAAADAVTRARVKLVVTAAEGLAEALEATATIG